MDKHYSDNTFLARWISGELTQEEIEVFKKSKDYPAFKRINEASLKLESPYYNKERLFTQLQSKKGDYLKNKPKVVRLIPNWAYGVAASVIIAFGVFYLLNMTSHYQTEFSQQLAVILPDNSAVKLNANSQLDFKTLNWNAEREVTLNGEAFFDVEKGETFKVVTSEGTIEVLGTEFNVIARDNYFQVQCNEGKVKVISNKINEETILLPGNAIRIVNNNSETWDFEEIRPNWLKGETSFKNTPLPQVIIDLENQFGVTFNTSGIDTSKRFTGSFSHKDLNLALKTVLIPMDISYTANDENIIVLTDSKNKI